MESIFIYSSLSSLSWLWDVCLAGLGAGLGFILSYFYTERREEKKEEQQRNLFLRMLRESLETNINRGKHMLEIIERGHTPTFSYDVRPISEAISSLGYLFAEDVDFRDCSRSHKKVLYYCSHNIKYWQ